MDKDVERCCIPKKILKEYSKTTTIHGIHFIGESNRSRWEKLYWLIVCLTSLIACCVLIRNVVHKSKQTPVIVTFSDKAIPIYEIPLPAITICPQNKFQRNFWNLSEIENDFKREKCLNDTKCTIGLDIATQICRRYTGTDYDKYNETIWYDIDYWIKKLAPDLTHSIKLCKLAHKMYSCQKLYREVYTASGICYTFNGLYPKELYRDKIIYLPFNHNGLPNTTWSLEKGYEMTHGNIYPFNSLGGTFQNSIEFSLNQFEYDLEPYCDFVQGFKVLIHAPNDIPFMKEEFIKLPLISDARFGIEPKYIKTAPELQKYSPEQRGCFFNNERYLKYFKIYTEDNCWLECLTNHTLFMCQCVFFYMPRYNGTPICGIGKITCLDSTIVDVIRQSTGEIKNFIRCNCKPSCTSISYHVDVTHSVENMSMLIDYLKRTDIKPEYIRHMNPTALTIFFKSTTFIPMLRSESFSKTDLVANCGGILGLFMGFSLISMAEILYYCSIRPLFMFYQRQKQKQKNTEVSDNIIQVGEWNQMMYISESDIENRDKVKQTNEDVIVYFN